MKLFLVFIAIAWTGASQSANPASIIPCTSVNPCVFFDQSQQLSGAPSTTPPYFIGAHLGTNLVFTPATASSPATLACSIIPAITLVVNGTNLVFTCNNQSLSITCTANFTLPQLTALANSLTVGK